MGRKKLQVEVGCRDCKRCMGSKVAVAGRRTGRALAGLYTLGMSEVAMATKKTCRVCGHQASLHTGADARF